MRRPLGRRAGLAVLAVAASLLPARPADATVERVRHGRAAFEPSARVHLIGDSDAPRVNRIVVEGDWVDTSNRWESSLAGVSVRKTGGSHKRLELEVTVASSVADASDGEIRIRYPIELSGFDRVRYRVFVRPKVVAALPGLPSTPISECTVGRTCYFRLLGFRMDQVAVSTAEVMLQAAGGRKYRKLRVSPVDPRGAVLEFEAAAEGEATIEGSLFADRRVHAQLQPESVSFDERPRTVTIRKLDVRDRKPVP